VPLKQPFWDWTELEEGSLALDRHELWVEPVWTPKDQVSRSQLLNPAQTSATVPRMSPRQPRSRQRQRARRQQQAVRRGRRVAILLLLAAVLVPTFLLTAFGGGGSNDLQSASPALAARLAPAGTPRPEVVAIYGNMRLQLPIAQSRVTAIGYHGGADGALPLSPVGSQVNQGLFGRLVHKLFGGGSGNVRWFQLPGGLGASTSGLDIGAAAGTDVYAPVDGTIVGLHDLILNGRPYGQQIEIQPNGAPSIVVTISHLRADPALTVGSGVAAASSRLGTLLDFSTVEKQTLARYTQDAGNHVSLEVHPAATLTLP
jgi:murein DD-endopeptidase MepM/ murein hydrolase activator NlpD